MITNLLRENLHGSKPACGRQGYGAFSYSHSHIDKVYNYILNQQEHHKKKTFREEYIGFLKRFEVAYNEKYLFEWYD